MNIALYINRILVVSMSVCLGALLTLNVLSTSPAYAQNNQQLSDKTVNFLVRFALKNMPPQVTDAKGKVIKFTKEDMQNAVLPIESVREIIRVGYRSGRAQNCGLPTEFQVANYQVLVKLAKERTNWTPVQRVFMSKLHWATVTLTTGATEVKEADAPSEKDKDKIQSRLDANKRINEQAKQNYEACSDQDKAQIRQQIETYVKTAQAQLNQ